MGEIAKDELRELLVGRNTSELFSLISGLVTKSELVNWILSHNIKNIEQAMWNGLGWKFEIKEKKGKER